MLLCIGLVTFMSFNVPDDSVVQIFEGFEMFAFGAYQYYSPWPDEGSLPGERHRGLVLASRQTGNHAVG